MSLNMNSYLSLDDLLKDVCGMAGVLPPQNNTDEPEAKFYIIWCPESDKPPRQKFHLSQAIKVVASMRARHPNQTFHIMAKVDE